MISIEKLPSQFYLYLKDDYREKLFQKVRDRLGSWDSVLKTLDVCYSTLYGMRRGSDHHKTGKYRGGKTFVNVGDLRKLVRLSGSDFHDIENNISAIKLQTGKALPISLPLRPSPQLASLVGHALGDGHIKNQTMNSRTFQKMVTFGIR